MVDAFGFYFITTPAFDGFVYTKDQWFFTGAKTFYQLLQQHPGCFQTRPFDQAQHPVVFMEMWFVFQTHKAKDSTHSMVAYTQQGAQKQYLDVLKYFFGKQRTKK